MRARFGCHLGGVVVFTDFDGTLSEVVATPDRAVAADGVADALRSLVDDGARVTVVSGRPVSFLVDRLDAAPVDLVGLYGLEWWADGVVERTPAASEWFSIVDGADAAATSELADLVVENKGLSLTVHYRTQPHRRAEVEAWASALSAASGLLARPAKSSVELHPPIDVDKGSVVRSRLGTSVDAVVMIGDDIGDLPAFEAVRALDDSIAKLNIVVSSAELDPNVEALADLMLTSPQAVVEFLSN